MGDNFLSLVFINEAVLSSVADIYLSLYLYVYAISIAGDNISGFPESDFLVQRNTLIKTVNIFSSFGVC